jgi:hypothetical protein
MIVAKFLMESDAERRESDGAGLHIVQAVVARTSSASAASA